MILALSRLSVIILTSMDYCTMYVSVWFLSFLLVCHLAMGIFDLVRNTLISFNICLGSRRRTKVCLCSGPIASF